MRALQFEAFGPPAEQLKLVEIPTPQPKAGEALIRLTHRAINPSDLLTVSGQYGILPKQFPAVPGFEGTGKIEALGTGVSGYEIGERVIPLGTNGTWQEYVTVRAEQLIPVVGGVSDQTAAQFFVNPVTAYIMLTEELDLEAGDWLLQTAAGSTLGRIVLQIAQINGIKTVNLVRRREQVDELLALGANAAFSTEDDDLEEQIINLTKGGVKGALDAVGGKTGALALQCLRRGGTMLAYGVLSFRPIPVDSGRMLFKSTTLRGFWLSEWMRRQPPNHINMVFTELMAMMSEGEIAPPVEAEYDLAQFVEAVTHADTPGRSGKILLTG